MKMFRNNILTHIFALANKTKMSLIEIYKIVITNFAEIIKNSIMLTSFLMAANYFTTKPSLDIKVKTTKVGYNLGNMNKFYKDKKIAVPEVISKKILPPNTLHITTSNVMHAYPLLPDEKLVEDLADKKEFNMDFRIDLLEGELCKPSYQQRLPDGMIASEELIKEKEFESTQKLFKSQLSKRDYYIFLVALMRSREVHNKIIIQNNGECDLRNIKIIIPIPKSIVTRQRDYYDVSNIRNNDKNMWTIDKTSDEIDMSTKLIKGGTSALIINIITKENPISQEDIQFNYDPVIVLKTNLILLFSVISLISFSLLYYLAESRKMKGMKRDRVSKSQKIE